MIPVYETHPCDRESWDAAKELAISLMEKDAKKCLIIAMMAAAAIAVACQADRYLVDVQWKILLDQFSNRVSPEE